jgi:hypothetical protein
MYALKKLAEQAKRGQQRARPSPAEVASASFRLTVAHQWPLRSTLAEVWRGKFEQARAKGATEAELAEADRWAQQWMAELEAAPEATLEAYRQGE